MDQSVPRDIAGVSVGRRGRYLAKYWQLYVLMLPGIAFFVVFRYWPLLGNVIAFKNYNFRLGMWGSPWATPVLQHFVSLFTSDKFYEVLRNTIVISLQKLIFGFPAPIVLALLLNEVSSTGFKRTVQTIVYLPHFVSWPIIAGLLVAFLSPDAGVVNRILRLFGGESVFFLASTEHFRGVLVLSHIWKTAGWGTIIYLAAISAVDPQLYEAATIDGASRLQQARYVTLPCIVSTIVILFILSMGNILEAGFDQIFILYNPSVYSVADVLETYIYRIGIVRARFDFATAAGTFLSVVGFVFVIGTNSLAKRLKQEAIF